MKTRKATVKERLDKIFRVHGADVSFGMASKLYLSAYAKKLSNQTFYQYRHEYKKKQQEIKESEEITETKHYPNLMAHISQVESELDAEANKTETFTSTPLPNQLPRDTYTFAELRKIKDLAKEMGGLAYLKEVVEALQHLQD